MKRRSALVGLLALAPTAWVEAAPGRVWSVGVGDSLRQAVAAAADGDTIELEAGDHVGQAAVITQQRLRLRGVGGHARLIANGAHAEGKALLVVRGGQVQIEQLEFRGARVPDGNGAGIRFESGRLHLRHCAFFDNENGLLASNLASAQLVIEACEFGDAPRHEGSLHHLLYVGRIGRLKLEGCRFSGGWRGHLVKSRAARNHILCNQLTDGDNGQASYELDLPNGGLAWVVGNLIEQGRQPQNPSLIAYGAEGRPHAHNALFVAHNSFVNRSGSTATFVRHWPDRLPPDAVLELRNNLCFGPGQTGSGGTPALGNQQRPLVDLDGTRWPRSVLRTAAAALPLVETAPERLGHALHPTHEIEVPLGLRALAPRRQWRPGAFQD